MDRKLVNIILLGFGFMFLFTAFQTITNIEKTVLDSIADDDPSFTGDGYLSLSIIYACFAICNWFAPSMITVTGPRGAMVIGGLTYLFFIVTFLFPTTWLLYVASALLGAGAAAIWTGHGNYLTLNSDTNTISRNCGIFWAMFQSSLIFGNLFVFIKLQGKTEIDVNIRNVVFGALTGICAVGLSFLMILRPAEGIGTLEVILSPVEAFKGAFKLFLTREMMLLGINYFYSGLILTFFSGVYSPSIGFTLAMGQVAKQLVGLSGVFIGFGEVLGGTLFGILGKKTTHWGRSPIVIMGCLVHVGSFLLISINLPAMAPFGDTEDVSLIKPSPHLAIFCSFLLGFGDACRNTQLLSLLGSNYARNSAPAFALTKFTQALAAAVGFFYSTMALLHVQLIILAVAAVLSAACFYHVERSSRKGPGTEHAITPAQPEAPSPNNM